MRTLYKNKNKNVIFIEEYVTTQTTSYKKNKFRNRSTLFQSS